MGAQSTEDKNLFVPKSYDKQAIKDLISGEIEFISIELESIGEKRVTNVVASLTIASLSGTIKSDVVIPLYNYQLYNNGLMMLFSIDDPLIPLNQRKELRRITDPIDLVGASTLNFTISFDDADCITGRYIFNGEWHEAS